MFQKSEELAVVCNPFGSDISCHSDHASRGSSLERSWSAGPWGRMKLLNLSDVPVFSPSVGPGVDISSDGEVETPCSTVIQDAQVNLSDSPIHVSQPNSPETEFVRIPKTEYEAIKNRVSAIENRISQEFGNMISVNETDTSAFAPASIPCSTEASSNTELVQTAYERTLVESEKLGDASADHLARRLSRELRIRRSLENKVIRSPSARKIGTMRRRSKENTKPICNQSPENNEIARNMSWHLAVRPSHAQINQFYPRCNLKRGRPNTVFTGLPQPSPRNTVNIENIGVACKYQHDLPSEDKNKQILQNYQSYLLDYDMMNMTDLTQYLDLCRESDGPMTRSKARRASSFHGSEWTFRNQSFRTKSFTNDMKSNSHGDIAQTIIPNSLSLEDNANTIDRTEQQKENYEWKTAEVFFSSDKNIKEETPVTGRASIAKLRSQNAGMVLERMKLFDAKANCSSLGHNEKEKSMTDSKTKRLVHVPSVFAHQSDVTQSVGIQYSRNTVTKKHSISRSSHNKLVQRTHSPEVAKSGVNVLQNPFKDSPKKIGTPRRRHGMKSPNGSNQKQKLKVKKSPSKVGPISIESPASTIHRKHNSMKLVRNRVCTNVKANLTVPINWLSTEKENVMSPCDNTYIQPNMRSQSGKDLKEESQLPLSQATVSDTLKEVRSPAVCKISVSPLKDCNRIEVNSQIPHFTIKDPSVVTGPGQRTPRETPYIKKALLTKSPSQFCRTPKSSLLSADRNGRHRQTPMKALAGFSSGTPVGSPRRQSPRLLALKS